MRGSASAKLKHLSQALLIVALLSIRALSVAAQTPTPELQLGRLAGTLTQDGFAALVSRVLAIDTLPRAGGPWKGSGDVRYAPIVIEGFSSIARVTFDRDTLRMLELSLPYRAKRNQRPEEPYVYHGFVSATPDDLSRLRARLTARFGEPSVSAEAFFEYLATDDRPMIVVRYADHRITVQVTPHGT